MPCEQEVAKILSLKLGAMEIPASPINTGTYTVLLGTMMLKIVLQGSQKTRTSLAILHAEFANEAGFLFAAFFISQRGCASCKSFTTI